MARYSTQLYRNNNGNGNFSFGSMIIMAIVIMLIASIGLQTSEINDHHEQELRKKSLLCMKQLNDLDCNPFSPTQQCKEVIGCVNSYNIPITKEIGQTASVAFNQFQKLSIAPLAVIGLILIAQLKKK